MEYPKPKTCSIILLCGYLGSGKTTLIQHILKTQTLYKVAVIQNEFSDEMGIEAPLMQNSNGEVFDKFYELPNGCICCSAKSDLLVAVDYFISNEKYQIDYILVETNGLADPSATIKTFWVDDEMKFPAELGAIVSVVSADKFENMRKEEIFVKQLIFANCILINKTDKINDDAINSIETELKAINPLTFIYKTKFCQIDLKLLFQGGDSFRFDSKDVDLLKNLQKKDHIHKHETTDFLTFEFEKPFVVKELEQKIGFLLWEKPEKMKTLRIKGIISILDDDYAYSLQGFY